MQVNKINHTIPQRLNKDSKYTNKNTQTFKGALDKGALLVADAIENGGLFVSFTLQDMLGTNLPRPIMGLMRNKKENKGQKNFKFAAKEMVREFTTGPSMFIIPAILLTIGKKIFGKATEIPMKILKSFGEIHAANPLNSAGQALNKEEFFQTAFEQIIKNTKGETELSETTINSAKDFAQRLASSLKDKKLVKETINNLTDDFVNIAKGSAQDAAHTDFTQAVLSKNTTAPIKDTLKFIVSYADDIVEKAAKQPAAKIGEYVRKLSTNKIIGRCAANVIMYAAVLTFLQVIPKLYNKAEGKENAGLKGLMAEETLKQSTNNEKTQQTSNSSEKSQNQPSFKGGINPTKIVNTLTGNGIIGKIAKGLEFEGVNVSFPMLLGIMGFGILFPRIRQAKDKYDREEILRRDLVTCITMCFAEKELRKGFSKLNENKSGFVLAAKENGFKNKNIFARLFDYLRPIKGVRVLTTPQIISKYSGLENYKNGIQGFCEFIESQGGNLGKVFSLTDESKNIVQSLLSEKGKDIATADNATIKEILSNAKGSEEIKKLFELFKDKNNPWVTKAKTLNARFTALSVIILVPMFLGFFLPWINERATKKRIQQENLKNKINSKIELNTEYLSHDKKAEQLFGNISKFIQ